MFILLQLLKYDTNIKLTQNYYLNNVVICGIIEVNKIVCKKFIEFDITYDKLCLQLLDPSL